MGVEVLGVVDSEKLTHIIGLNHLLAMAVGEHSCMVLKFV